MVGGSVKLGEKCWEGFRRSLSGGMGVAMKIFHCVGVSKSQRIKILNTNN